MIRRETPLQRLENAARKVPGIWSTASETINGVDVMVRRQEVMINRGMATGTTDRFTYYLDGKRVAFGVAYDAVCK